MSRLPSGLKLQLRQKDSWPSSVLRSSPLKASQSLHVLSVELLAMTSPLFETLQAVT